MTRFGVRSAGGGGDQRKRRGVLLPLRRIGGPFRIPAEEDERLDTGEKVDRRVFDDRHRRQIFVVDPAGPGVFRDEAGGAGGDLFRDDFRRNRLIRLVAERGQHAGFGVEEAPVLRGGLPGFSEHGGQSRLVRLFGGGVGVPADRVERRISAEGQHLLHPRHEGAGAADAEDHVGAVDRLEHGGNGFADCGVIARLIRHVAGGVRLVLHLPQADFSLVSLSCGAHEFRVAVELREAAAPPPGEFAHLRVGALPLPVRERCALQTDVHLPAGSEFPVEFFVPVPFGGRRIGVEPVIAVKVSQPRRSDDVAPAQVFVGKAQRQGIRPEAEDVHIAVVQAEQTGTGFFTAWLDVEKVAAELFPRV